MSVIAILQARVGSTRLPHKMLCELQDIPLVTHAIRRAKAANLVNRTILAIPDTQENDCLAAIAASEDCEVYRGSEDDLISRYYWAAERYPDADCIVRLTGDDWALDPSLIDLAVEMFLTEWASPRPNIDPPQLMHLGGLTWALGQNVEVFTRPALTLAYKEAPGWNREHPTQWMASELGVWVLKDPRARSDINTRMTLDTLEDYSTALKVYDKLYASDPLFGYDATLAALKELEVAA